MSWTMVQVGNLFSIYQTIQLKSFFKGFLNRSSRPQKVSSHLVVPHPGVLNIVFMRFLRACELVLQTSSNYGKLCQLTDKTYDGLHLANLFTKCF